jgi:hypothetical protein
MYGAEFRPLPHDADHEVLWNKAVNVHPDKHFQNRKFSHPANDILHRIDAELEMFLSGHAAIRHSYLLCLNVPPQSSTQFSSFMRPMD